MREWRGLCLRFIEPVLLHLPFPFTALRPDINSSCPSLLSTSLGIQESVPISAQKGLRGKAIYLRIWTRAPALPPPCFFFLARLYFSVHAFRDYFCLHFFPHSYAAIVDLRRLCLVFFNSTSESGSVRVREKRELGELPEPVLAGRRRSPQLGHAAFAQQINNEKRIRCPAEALRSPVGYAHQRKIAGPRNESLLL